MTSPDQLPQMLETAVRHARGRKGVAVLTVPGDLGERELTADRPARFSLNAPVSRPEEPAVVRAAELLDRSERTTLLVGRAAPVPPATTSSPSPTAWPRPWCSP